MRERPRILPRRAAAVCAGVACAVVALVVAGCSFGGAQTTDPSPEATTASSSAPATTSNPPSSTAAGTADSGASSAGACPATRASVPDSAQQSPAADLDGDGRADSLWLAERTDPDGAAVRTLGVATASGAVFSTDFTSAAPQAPAAIAARLSSSGPAIALLNTGRSVALYAVANCQLVVTTDARGEPYVFDLGFTGYGTGLGCEPVGSSEDLALYGLLAHQVSDGTWSVTGTRIDLSDSGRRAENGPTSDLVTGAADADVPAIAVARTVACGDQGQPVTAFR